jgi:acylphosphatase
MNGFRLVLVSLVLCRALAAAAADPAVNDRKREEPAVGRLVHYSGRVQGVGFRATAADIARDYPVTGWVKNLPDGRVALLVEGPESAVKKFLQAVRRRWEKNIDKEQVEERPAGDKFRTFEVVP